MKDWVLEKKREGDSPVVGGLVGFLAGMARRGRFGLGAMRAERSLKLVETLSLGGRRQLMLVSCGEQRFLVGGGADGVQTIVAVGPADSCVRSDEVRA